MPATVLLPEALAREIGATAGSSVRLTVAGRQLDVEVLDTLPAGAGDARVEPPIVTDIATAQELLGRTGTIDRIDLKLDARQAERLASAPPVGTVLVRAASETTSFDELARAFRTNLNALGLLALVVGTFLIYGTMSFAVLQRRATLGVLRAIGVGRAELVAGVLWEALALGIAATGVGLVVGHWLAGTLVELVLRTIGDLYFRAGVVAAAPSPSIYVEGAALGIGATLLAGAKPAIDAARAPPAAVLRRSDLERTSRRGMRIAAFAAAPLIAGSAVALWVGPRGLTVAFAALFGVLAAGALLVPAATLLFLRACESATSRVVQLPGTLAIRGARASLSRTGVATAALAVAVGTVNGVGLMISSFRTSLTDWLHTTLTADVYVAFDTDGAVLGDERLARLASVPGVESMTLTRAIVLPTSYGSLTVRGVQPGAAGWGLEIVEGEPSKALAALASGRGVAASERFAFARGLHPGDVLTLPTPEGERQWPIVGTFRDFNAGNYSVVIALDAYRSVWRDAAVTGIGLKLLRTADTARVEDAVRTALGSGTDYRFRSSATIERLSLDVFDRTFKITEVLRALAGIVAFLGVLSALLSIELDRARELGVLRSLGFSPRQLTATLLVQTGLLGAAAGLAAAPLGTVLAGLLVHVINRRSFGWTMSLSIGARPLIEGFALAVIAALLAGIYPAYRASRIELAAGLREE